VSIGGMKSAAGNLSRRTVPTDTQARGQVLVLREYQTEMLCEYSVSKERQRNAGANTVSADQPLFIQNTL
jgi:hypothetical protein